MTKKIKLSEKAQAIIQAAKLTGDQYAEIGKSLDISTATIYSLIKREANLTVQNQLLARILVDKAVIQLTKNQEATTKLLEDYVSLDWALNFSEAMFQQILEQHNPAKSK